MALVAVSLPDREISVDDSTRSPKSASEFVFYQSLSTLKDVSV